jgi:hypothetical protein
MRSKTGNRSCSTIMLLHGVYKESSWRLGNKKLLRDKFCREVPDQTCFIDCHKHVTSYHGNVNVFMIHQSEAKRFTDLPLTFDKSIALIYRSFWLWNIFYLLHVNGIPFLQSRSTGRHIWQVNMKSSLDQRVKDLRSTFSFKGCNDDVSEVTDCMEHVPLEGLTGTW